MENKQTNKKIKQQEKSILNSTFLFFFFPNLSVTSTKPVHVQGTFAGTLRVGKPITHLEH